MSVLRKAVIGKSNKKYDNGQNSPNIKLDERNHVEKPLLDQLEGLDWEIIDLDTKQHPKESHRQNFTDVVMLSVLREQLKIINPWLEDDQVEEVIKQLTSSFPGSNLISNNSYVFNLLLENTSVSENRKTGEKSPTVRFVDFTHRDNNRFIAVCHFKVRILGTEHHIIHKLTITVERDRRIVVHVPEGISDEEIHKLVEAKRQWIYEKISQYHDLPHPPGKELVSGESALYLGRQYRIEMVRDISEIQFAQRFFIPAIQISKRGEALRDWYICRAKEKIIPRVRHHASQLGVDFDKVKIVDSRYRWGSCTVNNNVN